MDVLVEISGVVMTEGFKVVSSWQDDDVLPGRVIGFVRTSGKKGNVATGIR